MSFDLVKNNYSCLAGKKEEMSAINAYKYRNKSIGIKINPVGGTNLAAFSGGFIPMQSCQYVDYTI